MEKLKDALNELIDARLIELGLVVEEPAAPAKGAKGGKGKGKSAPEPEPEEEEVTLDSIRTKLSAYIEANGKDEAKKLLKKFKVERVGDLPEAKFEKFNAELDAALGDGGDGDGDDDLM